jgi:hypothetical protein
MMHAGVESWAKCVGLASYGCLSASVQTGGILDPPHDQHCSGNMTINARSGLTTIPWIRKTILAQRRRGAEMKLVAHLGFVIDFWSLGNKTATTHC